MTTESKYDILGEILPAIDPAQLSYQEWVNVGFALKDGGYSARDWEDWSRRDPHRFHPGECEKKWATIRGEGVSLGTLVAYARQQGWVPQSAANDRALGWDDVIGGAGPSGGAGSDELAVVDPQAVEVHPLPRLFPEWHPARELTRYLELLFSPDEIVGYVTEVWYNQDKAKYMPSKGVYSRTAGELIADLAQHGDDLGATLGDSKPEAGAWIRFNPLDGQGIRNENVTEYRYALVESDSIPVEQQFALYRELELPARVLVHSGGKSLHAIVHIGAGSYNEYRDRVAYLYKVCEANGLKIDNQNKNPSRLSRLPGAIRGENQQYIVAENVGKASFDEWKAYIESINDDLPDPVCLADMWDNLPPLAPPLIDGVLRQGHKMLLVGPSKAGKSFALTELCVAIAEGLPWLGFQCAQGRVLYVNLELDANSCINRMHDVYSLMTGEKHPANIGNIDVWHLRGEAVPMDKLAPKLIRRAKKKNYIAIVIDPIYKVITGDENSADQMAKFCNQFDLVAHQVGCAVIYCHHHSKGSQGQKHSMDRASGSGVFARDPDALLDMIELPVSDDLGKQQGDRRVCELAMDALRNSMNKARWEGRPEDFVSQDDQQSAVGMLAACEQLLASFEYKRLLEAVEAARAQTRKRTAWRIEGTLREFERFPPVNLWFDYPLHIVDATGVLGDIQPENDDLRRRQARGAKNNKAASQDRSEGRKAQIENAIQLLGGLGTVTTAALYNYFTGVKTPDTVKKWMREAGYMGEAKPPYLVIKRPDTPV